MSSKKNNKRLNSKNVRYGSSTSVRSVKREKITASNRSILPRHEKKSISSVSPKKSVTDKVLKRILTYVFAAILTVLEFFQDVFNHLKKLLKIKKNLYTLISVASVASLVLVTVGIIWLLTNKNAQSVLLNDVEIGIIKDKNITAEELFDQAVRKLEAEQKVAVKVNDKVTTEPVHASKTQAIDYVVQELKKKFTYKVEAISFVVEGTEMAIVKSQEDIDFIKNEFVKRVSKEGVTFTDSGFVEDIEYVSKFVDKNEIMSNEQIISRLSETQEEEVIYIIQPNDVLGQIAINNKISVEDICALNEGMTVDTRLKIGSEIKLSRQKPLLSVYTVERSEYMSEIEMQKETVSNSNESKSYSKIIQQGREGQEKVTADIIYVNGTESERRIISTETVLEPIAQITEVGTK